MPAYTHLDADYSALRLGSRIREQRKQRGWTLADLATRLAVSVGTLSAVENDKLAVHVDLLLAISNVFDIPLGRLLPKSATAHFHITRRGYTVSQPPLPMKVVNRATEGLTSYHNKLWPLARPFVGKHIEPFEIEVQPITDREAQFISHNHQEFVFVLRGRIQCLLQTPDGPIEATLSAGDCIYFWSYLPHCIRSLETEPARTIHVEYSPDEPVDAEYGNSGAGPTIYLNDGGQENLSAKIAGKIIALRKARGMSASQFADQIGVSVRRLKQVERAAKPISLDFLLSVCRIFQKPQEYFLSPAPTQRPFTYVLRGRDIRRGASGSLRWKTERGCAAAAHVVPLAAGFPSHGMEPAVVRLDRRNAPPTLTAHPGQEFIYVLRGAVEFSTQFDGHTVREILLAGDACFFDSSVPHALAETRYTPYEPPGAEMLVVRCNPHSIDAAAAHRLAPAAAVRPAPKPVAARAAGQTRRASSR